MPNSEPSSAETSHQTKGLLRLTMACNERCTFCNVPVEDYQRPTPPESVVEAQLQEFIDSQARTLTISGGEPTLLRTRLLSLISRARAAEIDFVELQSNAVLIDADYAEALKNAGLTSAFISLLSHEAEAHEELTLLPGSFERCIAGIDHLLSAGIRVTLNPVVAHRTQAGIADFIDFVAARLPRVRSISLSAVQPHGRAGRDDGPSLLPDYAVLKTIIPEARRRARAHGIELLNPYCGVPLCIGWSDDTERSVEAFEASQGGWRPTPGIENQGDKIQGEPCTHCALRTRCGGAWRAYWDVRAGSGIEPPIRSTSPWDSQPSDPAAQQLIQALGGLSTCHWDAMSSAQSPTVWLHTDGLSRGDAPRILRSGCTDLALEVDPAGVESGTASDSLKRTLYELRQVLLRGNSHQPQGRLRVWLALAHRAPREDIEGLIQWARELGVFHIRLLPSDTI